jgi:uncharacterized repeat protein (TIGR02543 family)
VWGEVWIKVTSAPTSWEGEYLLVNEDANVAWTGVDAASCGASVTISSGKISSKPASAVTLTLATTTGGYSIKINGGTNNGKYIGRSANSNGMDIGTSAVKNTLAYDEDNSCITITGAGGAILRYNNSSDQKRFRYFKSSSYTSQKKIQLYKKYYTVTYNKNGGDGTMTDSNSPYAPNAIVTVLTNTFTAPSGKIFDKWNTKANGSGNDFVENATFTISKDTTFYAQWKSAASCTTNPTVSAASNSSVTATTATVTCSSGISSLGSAGCSISSYGFVMNTTGTPTISDTKYEVGQTYTTTGTSFYKDLTGLTAETTYYVRAYATNGNGTAYGTQTSFTTSALPKYTVTLKDDNSTLTQVSYGATVTLPTRTGCTGYTFAGWTKTWTSPQSSWTTTAPTIISAGSYTPEADENLYPVYTKTESGGGPSNDYELYSGSLTEGDYIIYYDGYAMNTTVTSDRLQYEEVTPDDDVITTTDESIIWHVAASGDYWTIYNANADAYAASTGAKNKAQMLADGTDDKSLWTVSGTSTYEFVNKQNTANSVNANLRNNGTYGFACYATSTGGALSLYKNVSGGSTTYYISVPNCCTDWSTPTVSYSSSLAINASEGVTIGSGTTYGTVTYESSDEDVLTVDADGTIHAVGAGTAHITATWAGDATYCEKSANSNDVTVSGIQVTGTTPVNFGQVYQNAVIADKTIYVTGLGLANTITPSLPAGSPFSFSPASLAKDCSGATLTISASTATLGTYNQTLTLTSGAFSATVTVKMEVIAMPTAAFTDALHNLTEDKDGVSLSSYNLTAAQGTPVVFPTLANQTKSAGTCEGEYYIFVGWTEGDNNTDPEAHLVTSHTLANGDAKNYYAVWADASGSATYTKLTSSSFKTAPAKYVLGGEYNGTQYFLHSYSGTDADVSWGECSSSETPIQFTLSGTAAALVAQDASGNYLAETSSAKKFRMNTSSSTVKLKSDGSIETTSYYLRFNYNNGTPGLRCYATEAQEPAYFYEVGAAGTVHYRTSCCANKVDAPVVTATAVTSTSITLTWPSDVKATGWQIEWNGAGGWVTPSGSCTHTVSGLTPNTTYTWRVRATYEDPVCGADVRSGSTTTNQVYHVTYAKGSGTGSCTASGSTTDETTYEAGATVTLQDNGFSLAGHTFAGWTEDDEDITISSNQFTMPDHDVVITASWTAKVDKYFDRMHDQTDELHGGVEETEGTNEGKYYIPKEGCNYTIPTASDSKTGDACQTSHYKLRGWIAASYMKGYPNNMTGEIGTGNESHIFEPTGTNTATGATYYAIWAKVVE